MKRLAFIVGQSVFLSTLFSAAWLCAISVIFSILPGWDTYAVSSGSMRPALDIGDVIITQDSIQNIEPGDVITFRRNEQIFTHRVHSKQSELIITKGDANLTKDSDPVVESNVIGKAKVILPGAGLMSVWIKENNWIALGMIFCGILISFLFLRSPSFMKEVEVIQSQRQRHRADTSSVFTLMQLFHTVLKRKKR